MNIHIVAAALPPLLDGIGDYTANIAAEIAKTNSVTILTAQGAECTPIPGVKIVPAFSVARPRTVRNILPLVAADKPDWVLLQYNPFSFGHWGLNLDLPLTLAAIARRTPTRVAVMFHEAFVPNIDWKFRVMALWQRWQFRRLGQDADALFFSIDPWVRQFRGWFPGKPVHHLPVGSNIPRVAITRQEARARLSIGDQTLVLGLFGTAHVSRMLGWVRDAADAIVATGQDLFVLYMGPDSATVCETFAGLPLLAEGPLPADEVSRRFAAVDLALTPFLDGTSTRRGSMLTGLQHGVATVGTHAGWTDQMLLDLNDKALLLADVNDPAAFRFQALRLAQDAGLRQRIGQAGQDLYDQEFDWVRLAKKISEVLR